MVSLHLPLTAQTRGLIGRAEMALMRPGSILLNTARGGIVDEQAPAEALRDPAHPLMAAAIDTFEREHAAFTSPLVGLPHALLTPHVAGMTRSAMATAALRCADHIAALLADPPDGVPKMARGRGSRSIFDLGNLDHLASRSVVSTRACPQGPPKLCCLETLPRWGNEC
ncbi:MULTISPECIES: NAD(P)-dependent oxidoreductase [unclassified Streptomyces]|uniref:NAD(P)-dependent oxidoreductase n=1 Tax=unclassified Streptomyces TaxID=2593676 RepID=UPI000A9B9981|nr:MULTISPECIES: NAD(P)-dependent oxidoreductase [unclassified Streptomyces]